MNFYFSAKVLDKLASVPYKSKRAMPTATAYVRNATVIIVKDAMYRNAAFDGTFLLGDHNDLPFPRKGIRSVEVYCCWFGHRLKTSGLNFKVDMSTAKVISKYTGKVASNLSIPKVKEEVEEEVEVDDEATQSSNFEEDNINAGHIVPTKLSILKNEPVSFSNILYASILMLLISSLFANTIPRDELEWANFLGKIIGVTLVLYVVNYFFKIYGVIAILIFYSIGLLYGLI